MHVAQVSNYMLVYYPLKEEYLLHRVRSLLPDQAVVLSVTKKHKALHFSNIFHDLVFLEQVLSHALLDHISTSHVASNGSLQDHSVGFNRVEHLTEPAHTEIRLHARSNLMDIVDSATHNQALETLLNLFC